MSMSQALLRPSQDDVPVENGDDDWLDQPLYSTNGRQETPEQQQQEGTTNGGGGTIIMEDPVRRHWEWSRFWQSRRSLLNPVMTVVQESSFWGRWNAFVRRRRHWILWLSIVILWPFGFFSFSSLQHVTDSSFAPAPNSPSGDAVKAFRNAFVNGKERTSVRDPQNAALIVVLTASDSNSSITDPESSSYEAARNYSLSLEAYMNNHIHQTFSLPGNKTSNTIKKFVEVTSFYSLEELGLKKLGDRLVYKNQQGNGETALIEIHYAAPIHVVETGHFRGFLNTLQELLIASVDPKQDEFSIRFTGLSWFQRDLQDSTHHDLKRMDGVVLPLALLILCAVLPFTGFMVMLIPIWTIISTICAWSIIMRMLCSFIQVTQFTPSVMMSLTIGMGIDYTLFLLSRYLVDMELLVSGRMQLSPQRQSKSYVIRTVLETSGHTILASGLTLQCTFLGLCFLPLSMLRSVGVGSAIAIGCALIVNFTIVPALLHTQFGYWIVKPRKKRRADDPEARTWYEWWCCSRGNSTEEQETETEQETDAVDYLILEGSEITENSIREDAEEEPEEPETTNEDEVVPKDSIWYKLSRRLLDERKGTQVLLAILILVLPVGIYCLDVKTSISFESLLPQSSPSLETFHYLGARFGLGPLSPYHIIIDGRQADKHIDSMEAFEVMHKLVDKLKNATATKGVASNQIDLVRSSLEERELQLESNDAQFETDYSGIATLDGIRISHSEFISSKTCALIKPHCPLPTLHILDFVDKLCTSTDRMTTFITATLGVDPFTDEGIGWLLSARDAIGKMEQKGELRGYQVFIDGNAGTGYDAVQVVFDSFPHVVAVTLGVVFLLMGFFFKSIVVPIRSVVSICLTLAFVFGFMVLLYRYKILNWTGMHMFVGDGEVSWLTPIMSFSIIVGLALDYDVFLISRILEFRKQGYDHKSSIVAGLHTTGGIITAAGIIMAVAFGGLMWSASPALYQWSLVLTTAVLLDTFVIRTLLVPILMGYTGDRYSWWPQRMPEGTIRIWEESGEQHHDANGSANPLL